MFKSKITIEEINSTKTNWEFINLLVEKYNLTYERKLKYSTLENAKKILSHNQIDLIRYSVFFAQIYNGGFLQFFSNGHNRLLESYDFFRNYKEMGSS